MQRLVDRGADHYLTCARCRGRLLHTSTPMPMLVASCVGAAGCCLLLGLGTPLFEIQLAGRFASAGVLDGASSLADRDMPELALVLILTLLVAPVVHLLILTLGLLGAHQRTPSRLLLMPLGLLETARRWSMLEVFLLATFVCYVRLHAWTTLQVGPALAGLIAATLVSAVAHSRLNVESLWQRMPWKRAEPRPVSGPQIACDWCGLLTNAGDGATCPRCGRALQLRKRHSLARATALLIAACLLTIPANFVPVMTMTRFGRPEAHTIFGGVLEMGEAHLWGLAAIIFVASIVIPVFKIIALAALLVLTKYGHPGHLMRRTRTYRALRELGRWSLVDVFAVAILVSLVRMGLLATVEPSYGAVAFCGVVLLTMLAVEEFDPRLMWDASEPSEAGA
ncbi:MAG TPA: paraquat-inducible protein A [Polyangiales bacterium]|nr:paraquat-inducible protein A [Polyangiales bacterium]